MPARRSCDVADHGGILRQLEVETDAHDGYRTVARPDRRTKWARPGAAQSLVQLVMRLSIVRILGAMTRRRTAIRTYIAACAVRPSPEFSSGLWGYSQGRVG